MFKEARELIATIREKDPAAHGAAEIIFAYPGFHAVMIHRFAHWCAIQGWTAFARWVSQVGRFLTGIEIHPKAKIGRRVFFDHAMGVVIGETAEVGDDCTIYQGVTLGGTNLTAGAKRHPTLENGVVVKSVPLSSPKASPASTSQAQSFTAISGTKPETNGWLTPKPLMWSSASLP